MSHVIQSNRIEALLHVLKKTLFASKDKPFQKRVIVVPKEEFKEMITSFLALQEEPKIAAGIKILPLFSLFSELGIDVSIPSALKLSFTIQERIVQHLNEPLFVPIREYLEVNWAQRLSGISTLLSFLFQRYQLYLKNTVPLTGWQHVLWEEVMPPLDGLAKVSLEETLHVFGFSEIPPLFLSFFQKQGALIYELSPCQVFWREILSYQERVFSENKLGTSLYQEEGNPFLAQFGKLGRQKNYEDLGFSLSPVYLEPKNTFLGHIQKALLELKSFEGLQRDASIQLFKAASLSQEVEILYQKLTALMQEQGIKKEEILILSPEIDAYLPFLLSTFGREEIKVYGISPPKQESFCDALKTALLVAEEDFSKTVIFELLNFPLHAEFRFSEEEKRTLYQWSEKVNLRRGSLEWKEGLNRLLLGLAVLPEEDKDYAIFPEPLLEWTDSDLLEKFMLFFETLENHLAAFSSAEEKTLSEWILALQALGDALFSFQDRSLLEFLSEDSTKLPFEAVRRVLDASIVGRHTSSKLYTITCAPLKGEYIQRAKITSVLGLSEEAFPRFEKKNSLKMLKTPEPSLTDRDLYRFLELLINTSEYFLLSYVHLDAKDQKEQNPSLVVSFFEEHFNLPIESVKEPFVCGSSFPFILKKEEELPEEIDLKHLRLLARNPLKFYVTQSLGIYLEEEEKEELLLSPLEKASVRDKQPSYLKTLQQRRKLPPGSFGLLAQQEIEQDQQEYKEALQALELEGEPIFTVHFAKGCSEILFHRDNALIAPEICVGHTRIIGKLLSVTKKGLLLYGEDSLEDLCKGLPLFCAYATLPFEKKLFFLKDAVGKTLEIDATFFVRYLEFYREALKTPVPFLPKWIPLFLKGEESKWRKVLFEEEDPYVRWLVQRDPLFFENLDFQALKEKCAYYSGFYGI